MVYTLQMLRNKESMKLMEKDQDKRLARYLSIMRGQCDRIAKIVKGLLEFSRFPQQKKGEVRLNDLIEKVFSLVEYETRFDNIRIAKELDRTVPCIIGDEEKLSQVFFNLFYNAWDSMPEGGTLTVTTAVNTDGMPNDKTGKHVEVTIKDTGCGIAEEHLNKIFDPFFSTKSDGNRTGLGLSLSYGIVQEHGGTIAIVSAEDEGTTVSVCLPTGE